MSKKSKPTSVPTAPGLCPCKRMKPFPPEALAGPSNRRFWSVVFNAQSAYSGLTLFSTIVLAHAVWGPGVEWASKGFVVGATLVVIVALYNFVVHCIELDKHYAN